MKLIFDCETDGLYDNVLCIHCLALYDLDEDKTYVFNDQGTHDPIVRGIQFLEDAEYLIGHNIIGYDIPVIKKLYPWFEPSGHVIDTLVLSHLFHADQLKQDAINKPKNMPAQLQGRHSLESYGYRLGEYKGGFAKTTDWKEWSEDMEQYMVQDVNVTRKLWNHFQPFLIGST